MQHVVGWIDTLRKISNIGLEGGCNIAFIVYFTSCLCSLNGVTRDVSVLSSFQMFSIAYEIYFKIGLFYCRKFTTRIVFFLQSEHKLKKKIVK